MTWTRAIARITVNGYRGTGALISTDGLVLTAFHVIADHERSIRDRRPAFHAAPLHIEFGDPKNAADLWTCGDGSATCERYSIDDDWALLRLCSGDVKAAPLPLAKAKANAPFDTFGFPKIEKKDGGQYKGTIGALAPRKVELVVDNLPLGVQMGGISGAPCIVHGEIVGIIQQALANEAAEAIKASLYMLPIERAIASFPGLVAWDDGTDILFQPEVEGSLPAAENLLGRMGKGLGLPEERRVLRQIARAILARDIETVALALRGCQVAATGAKTIAEAVGAMSLHADAIEKLRASRDAARIPLLETGTKRIHRWHLVRAFSDDVIDPNKIVVVRARNGDEELPDEAAPAARELPADQAAAAIITRIRAVLTRRVGQTLLKGMLSAVASANPDEARRRRFWVILIGESRPDVVEAVRARLPNAQVVLGLPDASVIPESFRERLQAVFPAMTQDEETRFLEIWESSASLLNVPVEPEEDDA